MFCLKNKTIKIVFYKLSGVVRHFDFMLIEKSWRRFKFLPFRDIAVPLYWIKWQTWLLSTKCIKNILHIKHIYIGQKSEWKPQKKPGWNNNQALTQWIMPVRFIQHPSNKAKFIRWVVYTTNAALMVG